MNGGQCQRAKGTPLILVSTFPSVISAGVGCRETRKSVVIAVLGHKYTGYILLDINSHLLLI